ncbi:MAG: SDR family NAD(P)-dependent oxidoreductase [Gammaproteobacteria bacterium]|nr:SDR family NAD(P)-dependent oxidoreductase [Gammaproteobacteria bacterium]
MPDTVRTVVLVTGATGAIGKAIAREIAAAPDHEVVVLARDRDKAARTVAELRRQTGNEHVRHVLADLSRRESIRALAAGWQGPLHVLVNDAGVTPRRREETPEGIELTFATNVLGYFWMIDEFRPHLERSAPAQVVNVASYYAGDLDQDDLEFHRRRYDNNTAYRQSKQANRMLTVAQAAELVDAGIRVNACHPGDVRSTLSANLGFGGSDSPEEAAHTPAMLALARLGATSTGRWFERGREAACPFARDRAAIDTLYEICRSYG